MHSELFRLSRRRVPSFLLAVALLGPAFATRANAQLPPLVPRDAIFPKPAAMQALRLSPDGRLISYLAADTAGVQQLWVREVAGGATRALTHVPAPGVMAYEWAQNSRIACYERQGEGGRVLVAADIVAGTERIVVAIDGASFGNIVTRPRVPNQLLLSVRTRGATEDDVYRLDLETGALGLDTKNPGRVPANWFYADANLEVRAAQRVRSDGGNELLVRDRISAPWRSWLGGDQSYALGIEAFSDDGEALLLRTDLRSDTAALVWRRISDGAERVLTRSADFDLETVLRHPATGRVQAVSYLADPRRWEVLDGTLRTDFREIGKLVPGSHVGIVSRDAADGRWLVTLSSDDPSRRFYLWDRRTRRATLIFEDRAHLKGYQFGRVRPIAFTARDGLRVHGYLTLPVGVPPRGLPLVVWVHGGPSLRDAWGFDYMGQLFVNRGYAFLRVNFRGSSGYGRRFQQAGRRQWGRAMQDDILDAVDFVVRSGQADRSRVAIIGHSYGGYSALAGLALTPDRFACGAASSTAADLVAFAAAFPRTPGNMWVFNTVGDAAVEADVAALRSASPVTFADRVTKPVLIVRGDKDGFAPSGIDEFVARVRVAGVEATSVVYEGDGHFFRRVNEMDYLARAEALFARCLGGRSEPMGGESLPGSTARVLTAAK